MSGLVTTTLCPVLTIIGDLFVFPWLKPLYWSKAKILVYFLLHFLAGRIFWLLFSCSYFPSAFLILETDQEICQFTCWITYFRLNFNLVYLVLSSLCSLDHNPGPDDQLAKKFSILYAISSCVFVFPTQKL